MTLLTQSGLTAPQGSWLTDFIDDHFVMPLARRSIPAANVKETDQSFELELAAPGFNKKDFNILVENDYLIVSAEKKDEQEEKGDNYTRREFGYHSFSRSFSLPSNTNEEDINAHYENGVLTLSIAKKALPEGKPKKAIAIK